MNLKLHLLSRIVVIAIACLIATAGYVLYQADRQAKNEIRLIAESIDKQLELQIWRIDAGYRQPERFPDFDLWKETRTAPGVCVAFLATDGRLKRSLCNGSSSISKTWPIWFETFYQWAFNPGVETRTTVAFNAKVHGSLVVTPSPEMVIADAWRHVRSLMGLSVSMTAALCLLVYVTVSRILQPAQIIVTGLEKMQQGDLSVRLPTFELPEWQRTGTAINQLAANQEKLLAGRKKLILKLMSVQEEERRYLARELHDEFGQCLAAIHALAASIAHTAQTECPVLVCEANNISRITAHMMTLLRGLLMHLRPAGIDELGLAASLTTLVAEWNAQSGGHIHYTLSLPDPPERLPEPLPITVFRIVQECLTNIAKHSAATHAQVTLQLTPASATENAAIELTITDDGIADKLPFAGHQGMGLLGIDERVSALGGRLTLSTRKPDGLAVRVWLPV